MHAIGLYLFWYCVCFISDIHTTEVDLSDQQRTSVPTDLATSLAVLNMKGNLVRILNAASFSNYPELFILDMSSNLLEIIEDGTFDQQTQLNDVNFRNNKIRQLPASFGPSTTTLETWHIFEGYTTMAIFQNPYFADFTRLYSLEIGFEDTELSLDPSILPSSLLWLDMHHSIMTTLPDLSSTPNLIELSSYSLGIEHIPQQHINALINLKHMYLHDNKITSMPNLSHMSMLSELVMYDNLVQEVPRSHILGLVSLESMYLYGNLLHTMPNISYLTKLTHVDFSENAITDVPASTLYGITNRLTLKLTKNKIAVIGDISALWAHVYLENNNLTTLPDLYNMRLETLMLEGNPLSCNQSLCWMRMWPWYKTLPTLDDAYCSTPSVMSDLKAVRVHPTQLQCFNGMSIMKSSANVVSTHATQKW